MKVSEPQHHNFPPGPKGHWLFGHTFSVLADPVLYTMQAGLDYPGVAHLRIMGNDAFIVSDPEYVRQIFLSDTASFCKGPYYGRLALIAGRGLITSEGSHWKRQRRLAQPGFHKERLRGFVQSFVDCTRDVMDRWEGYDPAKTWPISREMSTLTLNVVGETMFSLRMDRMPEDAPGAVKDILRFLNKRSYSLPRWPLHWPLPSHRLFFDRKREMDNLVYRIIDDRMSGKTGGEDLLDMFLSSLDEETGEKMSREDIRDEIMTVLMAGFETSSVALMWTWYLIGQHPEVEQKLHAEVDRVLGDRMPVAEDFVQLTYTRQILQESMRLYPPVFTIPRQAASDVKMGPFTLPKGSFVLTSITALHRSPAFWKDPEKFDPERFAPGREAEIEKLAYLPFGSGQRICLGNNFAMMEIVFAIAMIARRFKLRSPAGFVPRPLATITMSEVKGMPMYITKR